MSNSSTPPNDLVKFLNARLAYPKGNIHEKSESSSSAKAASPSATSELYLENFSVSVPDWKDPADGGSDGFDRKGGIAIVGKNGSGKTLLGKAITAAVESSGTDSNPYVLSGSIDMPLKDHQKALSASARKDRHLLGRAGGTNRSTSRSSTVAHVSFDSHRSLLEDRDEKSGDSVTAFKAIASAGNAPGRLNPAARFLVIRFGLYPMMHRTVDTLSTGEIRKVLLARALSTKPSLLILDNAFDGLDPPSRKILQELVSKTIKGFTNDLLVQGVSSKDTADTTQVILMSNRAEELDEIQEMDTVAWWGKDGGSSGDEDTWNVLRRSSLIQGVNHDDTENDTWSSGKEALNRSMEIDLPTEIPKDAAMDIDWEDANLPSEESVRKWWDQPSVGAEQSDQEILIEAKNLTVQKGDTTLLENLTWTVRRGERWIIGGGNGAGKSTLSRLLALRLATAEDKIENLQIFPNRDPSDPWTNIGWVSTESHMQHQQLSPDRISGNIATTRDFIRNQSSNASWDDAILPVLKWLGIFDDSPVSLLDRPFYMLSQGEQKIFLIATALVARPPLLILDEPCQGLDLVKRKRLLQIVETICRSTDMTLIYITHHLDEELVPSISHALHLKDRREVYKGLIKDYSAKEYYEDEENH